MPTPDRTSLDAIVTAARDLLEAEGLAALTMNAVAARVGVRAPSLYKRVRDRDALLVLVARATVDDLAERLAASDGTLAGVAHVYRGFAHERPEGFRLMFAVDGAASSLDQVSAPILRIAAEMVGTDAALEAARLVTAWATGFIQMELAGAFRLGGDLDRAFEYGLEVLERGLRA